MKHPILGDPGESRIAHFTLRWTYRKTPSSGGGIVTNTHRVSVLFTEEGRKFVLEEHVSRMCGHSNLTISKLRAKESQCPNGLVLLSRDETRAFFPVLSKMGGEHATHPRAVAFLIGTAGLNVAKSSSYGLSRRARGAYSALWKFLQSPECVPPEKSESDKLPETKAGHSHRLGNVSKMTGRKIPWGEGKRTIAVFESEYRETFILAGQLGVVGGHARGTSFTHDLLKTVAAKKHCVRLDDSQKAALYPIARDLGCGWAVQGQSGGWLVTVLVEYEGLQAMLANSLSPNMQQLYTNAVEAITRYHDWRREELEQEEAAKRAAQEAPLETSESPQESEDKFPDEDPLSLQEEPDETDESVPDPEEGSTPTGIPVIPLSGGSYVVPNLNAIVDLAVRSLRVMGEEPVVKMPGLTQEDAILALYDDPPDPLEVLALLEDSFERRLANGKRTLASSILLSLRALLTMEDRSDGPEDAAAQAREQTT